MLVPSQEPGGHCSRLETKILPNCMYDRIKKGPVNHHRPKLYGTPVRVYESEKACLIGTLTAVLARLVHYDGIGSGRGFNFR